MISSEEDSTQATGPEEGEVEEIHPMDALLEEESYSLETAAARRDQDRYDRPDH